MYEKGDKMRKSELFVVGVLVFQGACGAPEDDSDLSEAALRGAPNAAGFGESLHTTGAIDHTNPFFLQLGTNPRTCATCHSPAQGWTTSSDALTASLIITQGT